MCSQAVAPQTGLDTRGRCTLSEWVPGFGEGLADFSIDWNLETEERGLQWKTLSKSCRFSSVWIEISKCIIIFVFKVILIYSRATEGKHNTAYLQIQSSPSKICFAKGFMNRLFNVSDSGVSLTPAEDALSV